MGFFDFLFGKPKIDARDVHDIIAQALRVMQDMIPFQLDDLHKTIEEFYDKTSMWSACRKDSKAIDMYFALLAQHVSIYVIDNYRKSFSQQECIRLSQAIVIMQLWFAANNPKESPTKRVLEMIANQELAMQASYIISMDFSAEFVESKRIKINQIINLLAVGKTDDAFSLMLSS